MIVDVAPIVKIGPDFGLKTYEWYQNMGRDEIGEI